MFESSEMKFAVIGLGLFGKKLARELAAHGHQVLAVDHEEEPISAVQDEVSKAVIGNVKQEGLLDELITEDFEAVIVTMATDLEASLLSVLNAREIGVDRVVAKSSGPEHSTILQRLGLAEDDIISPEEDVAEQLAEEFADPNVHEYFQFQNGHGIIEMTVPDFFVGETLRDLNLREKHGIQVIGVRKAGASHVDYVPSPSEPFEAEDIVWITGPEDELHELS